MGATIEYNEDGSVDHDHDKLRAEREEREADLEGSDAPHSGTVDTSGEVHQSAAAVSPVFAEADQFFAETEMPEGAVYAPYVDPALEGEDANVPDFANADEKGRLVNDDGDIIDHTGAVVGNVDDPEPAPAEVLRDDAASHGGEIAGTDSEGYSEEGSQDGSEADSDAEEFNPSEHTVNEVNEYLAKSDEDEKALVLEAEAADKNRTTVNGIE